VSLFVGRKAQLHSTFTRLATPGPGVVLDVVGVHGIGKSMFLRELAVSAGDRGHLDPNRELLIYAPDLEELGWGIGFRDDYGGDAGASMLRETFDRSKQLMLQLSEGAPAHFFDTFRLECQLNRSFEPKLDLQNQLRVGRRSQFENVTLSIDLGEQIEREKQDRIRAAQQAVDDAFAAAWESYARTRQVLILVDQFEQIADDEIGHWLVRAACRLRNTVVVVARVPTGHHLGTGHSGRPPDRVVECSLAELSLDETARCLASRLDRAGLALGDGIVEVTHAFTGGHPGGVDIISRLLLEEAPRCVTGAELRRQLARLPEDRETWWAELIELILAAADSPLLADAVEAAAVVSSFDQRLMDALLAEPEEHTTRGAAAVGELRSRRLVQQIRTIGGTPTDRHRLHEFIRLSLDARVRTTAPAKWRELHERAATHYFELLRGWEDEPGAKAKAYGAWYRFEDLEWQMCKRQWLHHVGPITDHREVTRARFLLLFLEAFYWWGCYLPFEFNRRLLEDWDRIVVNWGAGTVHRQTIDDMRAKDQRFGDALTFFLDHYPTGSVKTGTTRWREIRSRLLRVRELCGLSRGGTLSQNEADLDDLRRANAYVELFLAHTHRFETPADADARGNYERATAYFRGVGEHWMTAWLLFEQADLALESGELSAALELVGEAAALVPEAVGPDGDWDYELLANLHRTRADVHWRQGRGGEAAMHYGEAIASAYWFQGVPHPPDEYTVELYHEMTQRCVERLVGDPAGEGGERPADLIARLRAVLPTPGAGDDDQLAALAVAGDQPGLVERLFPAAPTDADLHRDDSPFWDQWLEVRQKAPAPETSVRKLTSGDG
jgi:hypothetical protein